MGDSAKLRQKLQGEVGSFWLREFPNERASGTIHFNEGRPTLKLAGDGHDDHRLAFRKLGHVPEILGCVGADAITLLDGQVAGSGHWYGASHAWHSSVEPIFVLVGRYHPPPSACFRSISFSTNELEKVLNRPDFLGGRFI